MLELDGTGGGGQLLRTALSFSALSGRAFRMTGIREDRPKSGLRPQHVAAVRTLAAITDADVSGAEEGAETLRFRPGSIRSGRYEVDIGTAGSVTLLFDAVLPLATALDGLLALRARGGTDVKWAPAMDYYRRVKLPLLRRFGIACAIDVDRRGFYPAGGGDATLWLAPSNPGPVELVVPDSPTIARMFSVATIDLAEREVAERQAATALSGLDELGIDVTTRAVEYVEARSTGSALLARLDRGTSIAGFAALGERGTPAETVAERVLGRARSFEESEAAVDRHMADQLLAFLCLGGGRVSIPAVTDHVETNCALLSEFGYDVTIDRTGPCPVLAI